MSIWVHIFFLAPYLNEIKRIYFLPQPTFTKAVCCFCGLLVFFSIVNLKYKKKSKARMKKKITVKQQIKMYIGWAIKRAATFACFAYVTNPNGSRRSWNVNKNSLTLVSLHFFSLFAFFYFGNGQGHSFSEFCNLFYLQNHWITKWETKNQQWEGAAA